MRRYIKLHTVILDNDKVAALSSDAARWHYAKVLLHGKMTEPEGRWRSMSLLRSSVGEATFAYVPEYLAAQPEGLLIELPSGEIAIRQWWLWQGSDRKARQSEQAGRAQEKNRERWRRQKAAQRSRKAARGDVHPMSTDVHPNRETLVEDADRDGTSAVAPVPSASMRTCTDCGRPAEPDGWCRPCQGWSCDRCGRFSYDAMIDCGHVDA